MCDNILMTYSLDFRQKVFAYKEKHQLTFEQTSKHFEINNETLYRWKYKMEPCVSRDKPATKVDIERLKEDVALHPDAYQWERAQRLNVGQPAIHYALKRLNISFKKNSETS